MQWFQLSSTPCSGNLLVCGFSIGPQANWLITQHISRRLDTGQQFDTVSVEIQYELQSCEQERECIQGFDLFKWETSTIDRAGAIDIKNFLRVGTFSPNGSSNGTDSLVQRIDVVFETEESGVYLALMDHGTCVLIHRVFVFYEGSLCPRGKTGLIEHSAALSPLNSVVGICSANSNTLDGLNPVISCTNKGSWEVVTPCMCHPGFELTLVDGDASCSGRL